MANARHTGFLIPAAGVIAVLLVLVLMLARRDTATGPAKVSVPLVLAPAAAVPDLELLELDQMAASAPPAIPETRVATVPSQAAGKGKNAPAVVAVAQPTTIRRVVVSKGKRVVRNIPVAPPVASDAPVPRTARFDMSQNGKRMTADEFDAWMKAQGIRVAAGPPKPATVLPASPPASSANLPAAPVPPPSGCVPGKDQGC